MERRYRIGEVSEKTGVPTHVLRQWEAKVPQLKPKRDRSGRRYYTEDDLNVVRELKYLVHQKDMGLEAASVELGTTRRSGRLENREQIVNLLDKLEAEVRAMIDLVDSV
jgi:DNA-binding transcriptional MerR regulator